MEVSTFDDDLLDLSAFAQRLTKFIDVEQRFVQGSLVVALSSKFGSGKTTFLKMWKDQLANTVTGDEKERTLVVDLNAWESDYYGDPLFAIVSSLVSALRGNGKSATSLINAAKDVGWFVTAIGGQVVTKLTGIDPAAAGERAENQKSAREGSHGVSSDAFSIYERRKEAMIHLQNSIKTLVSDTESKVLFLVDELDRCRPDYAISYLETIKHIFDIPGAVFVVAADREQLENSAKTAFGQNLDFDEYYRKFIHREVTLPRISEQGYMKLAEKYVRSYLEKEGVRYCHLKIDSHRVGNIVELVKGLRLTPRQIQEVFRVVGHVLQTKEENTGKLLWCIGVGTIAMAAFKVGCPRMFHDFGSQQCAPTEALSFLTDLLGDSDSATWWLKLLLTGKALKLPTHESPEDVIANIGVIDMYTDRPQRTLLVEWYTGWGGAYRNWFTEIFEKIEQVSQWD